MKLTKEELEKYIKGVPVNNDELDDADFYDELDKDDMLDKTYPNKDHNGN